METQNLSAKLVRVSYESLEMYRLETGRKPTRLQMEETVAFMRHMYAREMRGTVEAQVVDELAGLYR